MIEDDVRTIISGSVDVPVYPRLIPSELPECVAVQYAGGRPVKAGIRRAVHIITLLAVSKDRQVASDRLRQVRNTLITSMPAELGDIHYYTAIALGDGSLRRKTTAGPVYIEYTDLEVLSS